MNRSEVLDELVRRTSHMPDTVERVLDAFCEIVAETVHDGENVNIRRFGKFEARPKKPVVRLNPKTGEPIEVPAKMSIGFVASPILKDQLNGTEPEDRPE